MNEALYVELLDEEDVDKIAKQSKTDQANAFLSHDAGLSEFDSGDTTDNELAELDRIENEIKKKRSVIKTHEELLELSEKLKNERLSDNSSDGQNQCDQLFRSKCLTVSSPDYSDSSLRSILQKHFGHSEFRPGQLEAIRYLLIDRESTLLCLNTSGGKSLVYQFVSLYLSGLTIVVTPLVSLMSDQLSNLSDCLNGAIWNSQMSSLEVTLLMKKLRKNEIKILFLSPEKLITASFTRFISQLLVSLVVIDECHCISEWSHAFRPAYARLKQACDKLSKKSHSILPMKPMCEKLNTIKLLSNDNDKFHENSDEPHSSDKLLDFCDSDKLDKNIGQSYNNSTQGTNDQYRRDTYQFHNKNDTYSDHNNNRPHKTHNSGPLILAMTATATKKTENEIVRKLNLRYVIRINKQQDNIKLNAINCLSDDNRFEKLVKLLQAPMFVAKQAIIIYVHTQKTSEVLCARLQQTGLFTKLCSYHAGLPSTKRSSIQKKFLNGRIRILIATIAFGMGIHCERVSSVIHWQASRSIENYVQEVGRGGRGLIIDKNNKSEPITNDCYLFYLKSDLIHSRALLMNETISHSVMEKLIHYLCSLSTNESDVLTCDVSETSQYYPVRALHYTQTPELTDNQLGTLLTQLESSHSHLIRIVTRLHNSVTICFTGKTDVDTLSTHIDIVRAIKMLYGTQFDLNTESFTIDLCKISRLMKLDILEVQSDLMKLRAYGDLSVHWNTTYSRQSLTSDFSQYSIYTNHDKWQDPSSYIIEYRTDVTKVDKNELVNCLSEYWRNYESIQLRKIQIMQTAIELCIHQSTKSEVSRSESDSMADVCNQDTALHSNNDENKPDNSRQITSMHDVIAEYFKCDDDREFLKLLQNQLSERQQNELSNDSIFDSTRFIADVKLFCSQYYDRSVDNSISAIDLVRIALGLNSEKFPAFQWKKLSIWGKYTEMEFQTLIQLAENGLTQYKQHKLKKIAIDKQKQVVKEIHQLSDQSFNKLYTDEAQI